VGGHRYPPGSSEGGFDLWLGDEGIVNGKTSTPSSIFQHFGVGIRRKSSLRLLLHLLFFMDMKFGAIVSLMNPGER
jgi:hypothetical protein